MSLKSLRERLNELDRQLIELIAERQSVVEQVGAFKQSEGQKIRDFAREKRVLDGARDTAGELGVAPDIAEEVMRLLIQTSLTRQELERVRAEGQGDGQTALVIGGSGKMGRWFAQFLNSQGYEVSIADPAEPPDGFAHFADWRDCANEFAITVIAAPLQVSADILIPSDIVVPQSVNRGVPVIQNAPRAGVSKALEELADLFAPARSGKKRRK